MNRAFLSLYIVVVFSVVLVGWGTDKLWQAYNPEPEIGPFETLFFDLVEAQMRGRTLEEVKLEAEELSVQLQRDVQMFTLEELAQSTLADKMASGEIVAIFDEEGRKSSYKRIAETDFIVRIQLEEKNLAYGEFYVVLLVAFYLVIAIVIYFWIWPLSRDLRRLQNQTRHIGTGGTPGKVELGQRSTVYSLAEAFNTMAERIHELINSHKEMTYAVSHELRTPLARMKFALEMASDSRSPEDKQHKIESVRADVAEMDKLINELLAYAGFEQHNQQLDFKGGDLVSMVNSLIAAEQQNGTRGDIHFRLVDELQGEKVYCEWYLMERCILNVMQNAAKYCRAGVRITLRRQATCYQVAVDDDGPGIDPEDADKVFSAFTRLRKEADENKSGFGLGLAIVHRIMKWHRGSVRVERSDLGGARFVLSWPDSLGRHRPKLS